MYAHEPLLLEERQMVQLEVQVALLEERLVLLVGQMVQLEVEVALLEERLVLLVVGQMVQLVVGQKLLEEQVALLEERLALLVVGQKLLEEAHAHILPQLLMGFSAWGPCTHNDTGGFIVCLTHLTSYMMKPHAPLLHISSPSLPEESESL